MFFMIPLYISFIHSLQTTFIIVFTIMLDTYGHTNAVCNPLTNVDEKNHSLIHNISFIILVLSFRYFRTRPPLLLPDRHLHPRYLASPEWGLHPREKNPSCFLQKSMHGVWRERMKGYLPLTIHSIDNTHTQTHTHTHTHWYLQASQSTQGDIKQKRAIPTLPVPSLIQHPATPTKDIRSGGDWWAVRDSTLGVGTRHNT